MIFIIIDIITIITNISTKSDYINEGNHKKQID